MGAPMSHLTISAIITNFNYAHYLGGAIESALSQTLAPIEVLVIDDGSTDGSQKVAEGFGSRVRWFSQTQQGVSVARNRGIQESQGEFVAFLDADDWWHPEKLSRQVKHFSDPSVGLVYCGLHFVDPDGKILGASTEWKEGFGLKDIVQLRWPGSPGLGSTALIRKSALDQVGLFDAALSTSADWDLGRRLACRYRIEMEPEVLISYRVHARSMHADVDLFERDMLRAFARAFSDPAAASVHDLRKRCYGRLYLMLSGSFLHAGKLGKSVAYAARGLAVWPQGAAYLASYPLRRFGRRRDLSVAGHSSYIHLADAKHS